MLTRIQKWGNSQGLRFPKTILEEAHIGLGDDVEVSAKAGQITIKAAVKLRGRYKLERLVAEMPADYCTAEESFGGPVGKEEW